MDKIEETLKTINKNRSPKYYYSCSVPLVYYDLIKNNIPIYLSLLANNTMNSVPNIKFRNNELIDSNVKYTNKLVKKSVMESLGIRKAYGAFSNIEEGLSFINSELRSGKGINVGVSTYFIPYSKDYHSRKYINDYATRTIGTTSHYIKILERKDNYYRVLDTTPILREEDLKIADFKVAWQTDKVITELQNLSNIKKLTAYSYFTVKTSNNIDTEMILKTSINTFRKSVSAYLNCKTIKEDDTVTYYGLEAIKKIILELENKNYLTNYSKVVQVLSEMRISRMFLYDIFIDICELFPSYQVFYTDFSQLFSYTNKIFMKIIVELMRNNIKPTTIKELTFDLKQIHSEEENLLLNLYNKSLEY